MIKNIYYRIKYYKIIKHYKKLAKELNQEEQKEIARDIFKQHWEDHKAKQKGYYNGSIILKVKKGNMELSQTGHNETDPQFGQCVYFDFGYRTMNIPTSGLCPWGVIRFFTKEK